METVALLVELLVRLTSWLFSVDSPIGVDRERRRQIRTLLKRARKFLQEGEDQRASVELNAALLLRPDTKALLATVEQLRQDLPG